MDPKSLQDEFYYKVVIILKHYLIEFHLEMNFSILVLYTMINVENLPLEMESSLLTSHCISCCGKSWCSKCMKKEGKKQQVYAVRVRGK